MSNQKSFFPSIMKLNVGGKRFTTSLQTLTRDPNSMLATMFSGRHELETTEDGSFFIDRDGTYFRFILNYLRNGELILPEGATFLEELEAEARFYQVRGVLEKLKAMKTLRKSAILTEGEYRSVLIGWIPQEYMLVGEWRLLFRASRDGFNASVFHSRCDNKGPTVTVVKSGGNILGGFTENAWTSRGECVPCRHAFLFSFVNPSGLGQTRLSLNSGKEHLAIFCDGSLGPVFRNGLNNELRISSRSGISYLGYTYQCPPGQRNMTFFTGAYSFGVTDYDVCGLRQ